MKTWNRAWRRHVSRQACACNEARVSARLFPALSNVVRANIRAEPSSPAQLSSSQCINVYNEEDELCRNALFAYEWDPAGQVNND